LKDIRRNAAGRTCSGMTRNLKKSTKHAEKDG